MPLLLFWINIMKKLEKKFMRKEEIIIMAIFIYLAFNIFFMCLMNFGYGFGIYDIRSAINYGSSLDIVIAVLHHFPMATFSYHLLNKAYWPGIIIDLIFLIWYIISIIMFACSKRKKKKPV